ncbi:MAG: ribonuclease P protein component [Verrucomicrobiota bacterium]
MPGEVPAGALKFPKSRRLQKNWEFERVRREGKRLVKGCLILNWRSSEGLRECKLGVVTSKKIGNAVERSRARRLMRQAFRLHQNEIERKSELVLVARPSIGGKDFLEVEKDFLRLLKEAKLRGEA